MTFTGRFTAALLLIFSTIAFAADAPFDLVIAKGHIVGEDAASRASPEARPTV